MCYITLFCFYYCCHSRDPRDPRLSPAKSKNNIHNFIINDLGRLYDKRPSLLGLDYFAPRSTQPTIPPGSVNEYQLRLGMQRQIWLIPIADERVGVQVKLWNRLRTRAIPKRFCGGDSLRRGAISSVCTFTYAPSLSLGYAKVTLWQWLVRSRESWVMGQGSRGSWVIKCDPLSALEYGVENKFSFFSKRYKQNADIKIT